MNFRRLLTTKLGVFFISAILGFGLATLFRQACNGKSCINFKGPRVDDIDGKTYQFGDSCYSYHLVPSKCNANKKTIELQEPKPKQKLNEMNITDADIKAAFNDLDSTEKTEAKETNLGNYFTSIKDYISNMFS